MFPYFHAHSSSATYEISLYAFFNQINLTDQMKRKALEDCSERPEKRRPLDVDENVSTGMRLSFHEPYPFRAYRAYRANNICAAEEASSHVGSDDVSTLRGPADIDAETPPTIATDATTSSGRRKFPSELKTIPCTVAGCDKKFNRPARLVAHLRSHNNERPYRCTYPDCDKAYTDNKFLQGHILSAHTKEARFVCDECGKGFATGQRLKRHGLVHQGEERYRCRDYPPCTQSFRKHQTLQRHVLKEHLGQKPYQCTHAGCKESYDTANNLKAHVTREHGELKFWCDECSAPAQGQDASADKKPVGFTTQFLLEQHIRQQHVNCIFCDGMKFGGQYELEQHMEIYHSGLTVKDRKNVPCDFEGCDKKFTKKSNMKAHYRTAHEGKRFVCGQMNTWESAGLEDWNWTEEGCGQTFVNKAALEQHVLYVHLGNKRPQYDGPPKAQQQDAKAQASSPDPEGNLGFLDELSGVAAHERRQAVCTVVPGCSARFTRYADLHDHISAEHPKHATFGLLGAAEAPRPDWFDDDDGNTANDPWQGAEPRQKRQGEEQEERRDPMWSQEDVNLMQLLDLDGAIDPNLFASS